LAIPALAIACLPMAQPAASECLSPSAEAGATATTVYRCPEATEPSAERSATAKQPLATEEKSTVVERGSADVPWFEPPPKQDPITTAKTPQETDEAVAPKTKTKATTIKPAKAATIKPAKAAATEDEAAVAAPEPEQPKITKKATAKKKVIAKKRKIKKTKVAASKKAKTKTKTVEPATAKIESKPPDEKTIVWTKKDMPIGSRIVNWLGF
jgi:hypothetical protein